MGRNSAKKLARQLERISVEGASKVTTSTSSGSKSSKDKDKGKGKGKTSIGGTQFGVTRKVSRVGSAPETLSKSAKKRIGRQLTSDLDKLMLAMSGNTSSTSTEKVLQARAKSQLGPKKKKVSRAATRKKKRAIKTVADGKDFQDRLSAKLEKRQHKALQKSLL